MNTEQLILEAAHQATTLQVPPPHSDPGEIKHVTPALRDALEARLGEGKARGKKVAVSGWSPSPGSVDIALGDPPLYDALIEVKVGDLGWCLSDMAKIASLVHAGQTRAGYLIVAGTDEMFATGFATKLQPGRHRTESLFRAYPDDWLELLRGGPGRPQYLPDTIELEHVYTGRFSNHPQWSRQTLPVIQPLTTPKHSPPRTAGSVPSCLWSGTSRS